MKAPALRFSTASSFEPRGFDGAKSLVGRKLHLMGRAEGLPMNVLVMAGNVSDREGGKRLLGR